MAADAAAAAAAAVARRGRVSSINCCAFGCGFLRVGGFLRVKSFEFGPAALQRANPSMSPSRLRFLFRSRLTRPRPGDARGAVLQRGDAPIDIITPHKVAPAAAPPPALMLSALAYTWSKLEQERWGGWYGGAGVRESPP